MFKKILIANRGEIACRVIKTAKKMGIKTVAVYSDADKNALHVKMVDEAVHIGPSQASESYLNINKIVDVAKKTQADAVHPGYGFLSENPSFAKKLKQKKIAFVGPSAEAIEAMGDKIQSKRIASEAKVSTVPGYDGIIKDEDEAVKVAEKIGYPVMIKASAGGGGKGMRIAQNQEEVRQNFGACQSEAVSSFGDGRVFIEKFIQKPRHIEIQVLADKFGNTIYLGERECSIQRRNQKVIEEAPSPFLTPQTRKKMGEQAVALAKAVKYESAGTVEFIVDQNQNFYFLEMNTRLQVEHPVTEMITGIDLVEQMIRIAANQKLKINQKQTKLSGWAMEARLYAEDPYRNFLPAIGRLTRYRPPEEVNTKKMVIRNDTGVEEGSEISIYYDPMIAKFCVWGENRKNTIRIMRKALDKFEIDGIGHNLPFLSAVMDNKNFAKGDISTAFIDEEFGGGFNGIRHSEQVTKKIVACVVVAHIIRELRNTRISGTLDNHTRRVAAEWVVQINKKEYPVRAKPRDDGAEIKFVKSKEVIDVSSQWRPGQYLMNAQVNKEEMTLKVTPTATGFDVKYRGGEMQTKILSDRVAELYKYMPAQKVSDTENALVCPMPGLVVSVHVGEGDEVEQGQPLATIEAMKMENVLRATKKTKVKKVNAKKGDTLAADDIILEFA